MLDTATGVDAGGTLGSISVLDSAYVILYRILSGLPILAGSFQDLRYFKNLLPSVLTESSSLLRRTMSDKYLLPG